jgi:hypothetical protein
MKTCCNCGATEEEAGPIDLVTDECPECLEAEPDDERGLQHADA